MVGHDAVYPAVIKRQIPWDVFCHLAFSGRLLQLGIIPLLAGIALLYCAFPTIVTTAALKGKLLSAPGIVSLSQDTKETNKENQPIYENHYGFTSADGQSHRGISYGNYVDTAKLPDVTVRYSKIDPQLSVIQGMRGTKSSLLLAELSVVPLVIGLVLVVSGLFENWNVFNVLRQGSMGTAVLSDKQESKKTVNQHPVYLYVYDFTTPSGKVRRLSLNTFEWLSESQPVLYSNNAKEFAALIVAMPGKLSLASGKITSHTSLFQTMMMPLIGLFCAAGIVAACR
jgi:hypothetical protein